MKIDVSELLAFADSAEEEADKMAEGLVEDVTAAAAVGESVAKAWAPRATGRLERSINTRVVGSGRTPAGVRATIRADVPYGWYVEAGTARQRPQPYMQRGRDAAEPVLEQRLERRVGKAFG